MDFLALIISILAVAVSAGSVKYTRDQAKAAQAQIGYAREQADAAREQVKVAREQTAYARNQAEAAQEQTAHQKHLAGKPELSLAFVPRLGGHYDLRLRNEGPTNLDRLDVELVNPALPHEPGLREISDADALQSAAALAVSFEPFRVGDSRHIGLWRNGRMRDQTVMLRCTCYVASEEPWQVLVEAVAPADA
jgi:hypothetical protein